MGVRAGPGGSEVPVLFEVGPQQPTAFEQAAADAAATFEGVKVAQRADTLEFTGSLRGGGGAVGFTVPGRQIANPNQVLVALTRAYPPELRRAGVGGTVQLRLFVNEPGAVTSSAVSASSGRPELDSAALKVGPVYRFTRGQAGWLLLPVRFEAR
ncbi:MAG: TonB family protein [Gemmatimonadetes bacterium]|nr:TonB family protein [Gemmatimonadota bacterium]